MFSENPEIQNFMKIRPVGAALLYVQRRTDMTKLTAAFRNLRTRLKMDIFGGKVEITRIVLINPYPANA